MNREYLINNDLQAMLDGFCVDPNDGTCSCLYCRAAFEQGMIYDVEGGRADAKKAAHLHVVTAHGGAFAALLEQRSAGLPAVQEKVLRLLYEGRSDAEIARSLGGKSPSTVRNHRLVLRRRQTEARAFLALVTLLNRRQPGTPRFGGHPAGQAARAGRAAVSEGEAQTVEARYLRELPGGELQLTGWPRKQKDRLVLLRRIAGQFETGKRYTEKEVNAVLVPVWPDHVTIRRYLIQYRFLDRRADSSEYWKL